MGKKIPILPFLANTVLFCSTTSKWGSGPLHIIFPLRSD